MSWFPFANFSALSLSLTVQVKVILSAVLEASTFTALATHLKIITPHSLGLAAEYKVLVKVDAVT